MHFLPALCPLLFWWDSVQMPWCPSPESVQKSHQSKHSNLSSHNQLPQPRGCREIFSLPSSTTHAKVNAISYSWKYTISQKFGVILSTMAPEKQRAEICHPWTNCWVCCLNLPVGFTPPLQLHHETRPVWRLQCPPLILVGKTPLCTTVLISQASLVSWRKWSYPQK